MNSAKKNEKGADIIKRKNISLLEFSSFTDSIIRKSWTTYQYNPSALKRV